MILVNLGQQARVHQSAFTNFKNSIEGDMEAINSAPKPRASEDFCTLALFLGMVLITGIVVTKIRAVRDNPGVSLN